MNWALAEQYFVGDDDQFEVANEAADNEVQEKLKTNAIFLQNLSNIVSGGGGGDEAE